MTRVELAAWLLFGGMILMAIGVVLAPGWTITGLLFSAIGGFTFGFAFSALIKKR